MELELTLDNFDAEIGKSTPILVDFRALFSSLRTKATEAIASARLMLTNSRNLQSVSALQAFRR